MQQEIRYLLMRLVKRSGQGGKFWLEGALGSCLCRKKHEGRQAPHDNWRQKAYEKRLGKKIFPERSAERYNRFLYKNLSVFPKMG